MRRNKIFIFLIIFLIGNTVFISSQELPKVMYVNSKEGLNQRNMPSINGEKTGVLMHGARIIVYERSNYETIDGISNFWYRTGTGGWVWVFGGYLSDEIPLDVYPIIGMWNTDKGNRFYWNFSPDHKINSGRKESDSMIYGDWNIIEKELTINLIPIEFMAYKEEKITITVKIIDKNNIILFHNDGSIEQLTRNNNIY